MENFMKQMRPRLTSAEPEDKGDPGGSRDQKISAQKTQSFKGKKKAQNWFQRQFISKTSGDYDSRDLDHATAVAAAAHAISSQEISEIPQKKTSEAPQRSLSKTRSKVDGPKSGSFRDEKKPEKDITPVLSKKKSSSFRELLKTKSNTTAPEIPPPITQTLTKPTTGETEADAWEKAQLGKIKQKYDKLNETIDSWESKKKLKAKRKLNMQESELEQTRVRAMDKFRNEMQYIDQVAGGARTQAEARRRNEELEAKEKANRIRTTGRLPRACICF